jgi:S-adenosylmethionine:tRNA ribosyltransferase-isomerase
MKLTDFDYQIPEDRIAQYPLKERDSSKLFVLHKKTNRSEHRIFGNIIDYLHAGDVLVLNDTRVVPVRLCGVKPTGGKAEITLIKELEQNTWEAFVKGLNEGRILLPQGITADIARINGTIAKARFHFGGDIKGVLHKIGQMPLPVYIKRDAAKSDEKQYQTVYAKKDGAIAAPTAGLHFTDDLLLNIRKKGVKVHTVTLHVGHGTFRPVTADDISKHKMDDEFFEIPESTAQAINSAKTEGRRVIAVGTTVTRTLESSVENKISNNIVPGSGKASIFIYPGYKFQIIDALITNFHLPGSTPLMLTSAFSGLDLLMKAYRESQEKGYRFYSYGDAMLILQGAKGKRGIGE